MNGTRGQILIGRRFNPRALPLLSGRAARGDRKLLRETRALLVSENLLEDVADTGSPLFVRRTDAGVLLFLLAGERGDLVVVKLATGPEACASLDGEAFALTALTCETSLRGLRQLLPRIELNGWLSAKRCLVTSGLPGQPASESDSSLTERALMRAASVASALHEQTAETREVSADDIERWSDVAFMRLAALDSGRLRPALIHLRRELYTGLCGRRARLSWVHGDYWLGNVLVEPAAGEVRVTGIVDWDLAEPTALGATDVLHLLLTARAVAKKHEIGNVISRHLLDPRWSRAERRILAAGEVWFEDPSEERAAVLLTWLRHLSGNLGQPVGELRRRRWLRKNVDEVLRVVTPVGGRS